MNLDEAQRRQSQARAVNALASEKEMYARLCVCLVNAMREGGSYPEVGGHVAVPRADFEGVGQLFTIGVTPATCEAEDDDDPPMDLLILEVKAREKANGSLAVPQNRIVVP